MKILSKTIVLMALFLQLFQPKAMADDVYGADNLFIKVTKSADELASKFELCKVNNVNDCKPLGRTLNGQAQYYSISTLERAYQKEKPDAATAVALNVVIGVVTTFIPGVPVAFAIKGFFVSGLSEIVILVAPVATGITGGVLVSKVVDGLNPVEQNRQARMLKNDVIQDLNVNLKKPIEQYAKSLHKVLVDLDPMH
jgi:hypothetical protein